MTFSLFVVNRNRERTRWRRRKMESMLVALARIISCSLLSDGCSLPRHSRTTHAASGCSRHVTRVRRMQAHNARVARRMRSGCCSSTSNRHSSRCRCRCSGCNISSFISINDLATRCSLVPKGLYNKSSTYDRILAKFSIRSVYR